MRVSVRSVTQTRRRKALWKLTQLWKNQRTVFPQLLEPSVHSFHNAGCCGNFKHNISCTPAVAGTETAAGGSGPAGGPGKVWAEDPGQAAAGEHERCGSAGDEDAQRGVPSCGQCAVGD